MFILFVLAMPIVGCQDNDEYKKEAEYRKNIESGDTAIANENYEAALLYYQDVEKVKDTEEIKGKLEEAKKYRQEQLESLKKSEAINATIQIKNMENDNKTLYLKCLKELEIHYKKLNDVYKEAKRSPSDWGMFSAKWNRDLSEIREKYNIGGQAHPNSVKFHLGLAAGYMTSLWSEYNAVIDQRSNGEPIKTFKSYIDKDLAQAKEKLK